MTNHSNNRSPGIISQVFDAVAGWYTYSVVFTVVAVFVLGVANFVHTFMPWWGLAILSALAVVLVVGAEKRNRMPQAQRMLMGVGLMIVFLSMPHILLDGPVPLGELPAAAPSAPGQIDVGHMMASLQQGYMMLAENMMYILMALLMMGCFIVWRKED